jgi:DNA-directed RNA polymerase specialized sigma24 family protein
VGLLEQRVFRDRPTAEVAAELGKSENAVYIAVHRVLQYVRAECRRREEELGRG